jgi:hypothetical protein
MRAPCFQKACSTIQQFRFKKLPARPKSAPFAAPFTLWFAHHRAFAPHSFLLLNQAVFATFISGDGGGKDGLEELQTRLRRISTCAQFSAK